MSVLAIAMMAVPAHAADWLGASDDWAAASNWNPAGEPGSGTAVNINVVGATAPYAPVISAAGEVAGTTSIGTQVGQAGALTISGTGTLTAGGSYFAVGDQGTGTVTISGGGQLTTATYATIGNYDTANGTMTLPAPAPSGR